MTLKRNLRVVIFCKSINKTPIDAQTKLKTGVRIVWSGKIVMFEAKTIISSDRIQILNPEESPEISNAKMKIICKIWPVTDSNAVLEEKLSKCR